MFVAIKNATVLIVSKTHIYQKKKSKLCIVDLSKQLTLFQSDANATKSNRFDDEIMLDFSIDKSSLTW